MQRLNFIFFLFAMLVFSACSSNKPVSIKKDTLAYFYQTIKEQQVNCANKSDRECILMQIKYPIFKANKTLNDSIQNIIIFNYGLEAGPYGSDRSPNLQLSAKNYGDEFRKSLKHPDHGLAPMDYIRLSIDVLKQDSGFVSVNVIDTGYPFAYRNDKNRTPFIYPSNWDIKKNSKILLKDILIKNYEIPLNKIAEHIFRKQEGLTDTVSFKQFADTGSGKPEKFTDPYNQRYFYKFEKFEVFDGRFLITSSGLKFRYNSFDIKAFSAGPTDLLIPYQSIKYLLRPNTVISQYIK